MSVRDDDLRAFPFSGEYGHPAACGGMSLRDYFAAAALQGILAGPCSRQGVPLSEWLDAPEQAYKVADAMLAERSK